MQEGTLLLAAACLPLQANDWNITELCLSCHSLEPCEQNEPSGSQARCWKGGHLEGEQGTSVKFRS